MIYEIRTYRSSPAAWPRSRSASARPTRTARSTRRSPPSGTPRSGRSTRSSTCGATRTSAERNRLRAEAAKAANWPPKIAEFIETMQSEIVVPFAFLPDLKPGKMGPIFEMRYYAMKAGIAAGPDQALGVEDRGAGQDVADRAGRPRRARRGQPLHPHLGLQEPGRAGRGPEQGARDGRVAAPGRRATPCSPWPTRS